MYFRDEAGGSASLIGEFLMPLAQAGIFTALGSILTVWLQGRVGRRVRLKVDDIEVEGRTLEEVELLLQRAKEFQSKPTMAKEEGQP